MLESMLMYSGKPEPSGGTYEEFLDIISDVPEHPASISPGYYVGYLKLFLAYNEEGAMYGTPWKSCVTADSRLGRIARHCFPNLDAVNNTHKNKRYVLMKFNAHPDWPEFIELDRNGLKSIPYTSMWGEGVTDFVYFDDELGGMQRMNPFEGEGPIPWNKELVP